MVKRQTTYVILVLLALALAAFTGCSSDKQGQEKSALIEIPTPERAKGQTDVIALRAPALDTVRVGFIGLGMRGPGAVERFTEIPGAKVVALCDQDEARVEVAQEILKGKGLPAAVGYAGNQEVWRELVERDDLDLIYIVTDWRNHAEMALYAMEKGKHVAVEVPGAMTLEEIWKLIDMSEKTRKHCMMLENCVYDFFEITTLEMAQRGLFGELVHVEGSYIHNLEDFWHAYKDNWRLAYNQQFRGDVYPTHGMGPACQLLNIHRGDKMDVLVSMDTKAFTGPKLVAKEGENPDTIPFANGDHTMTMIRTHNGKTLQIQHNVMNPRPYSRMYQLTGTNGYASKYPIAQYLFRPEAEALEGLPDHENLNAHRPISDEQRMRLMQEYKPRILQEIEEKAKSVGGHGGMDYIMDYRLVYCLRNGLPLDMDVYDLAEWSCLAELSRISLEHGSAPVMVPDFTRGAWQKLKGYKPAFKD